MRTLVKNFMKKKIMGVVSQSFQERVLPLYGDSYWYEGANLWEPSVLTTLKDLIKPNSVVFDVGANMGGLTQAMSRLVGPRGTVCAFEASPRIIGYLQQNIVRSGCHNVTAYHRAVYSVSGKSMLMYEGGHLNDSLYMENSPTKIGKSVKTLSLDDFCSYSKLIPELIKMDIEGAELEALLGGKELIEQHAPHLILEQSIGDTRCLNFLLNKGYLGMDTSNYTLIDSEAAFPKTGMGVRNILYLHRDKIKELPYPLPISLADQLTLSTNDFKINHLKGYTSQEFELEEGRYVFDLDFTATDASSNMMCGVRVDGMDIFRYHASSKLIAEWHRDWLVDISRKGKCTIYFDFQGGTSDPSLRLSKVQIRKLEGVKTPVWAGLVVD